MDCGRKSYSKDVCVFAIMPSTEIWNKRKFRIESYDPNSTVDLDIWSRRQSDQAKMIIHPVTPQFESIQLKTLQERVRVQKAPQDCQDL